MSVFKKILALALFVGIANVCSFAEGVAEDPTPLKGSAAVDLSAATVSMVSPLNALPGTLIGVEGSGFGTKPGVVKLGDTVIDSFLSWEDGAIFFRIPKGGLAGPVEVQVGNAYSEDQIRPAPAGSITIRWNINTKKLNEFVAKSWKEMNAPALPKFKAPFYFKGEWIKAGEVYGNAALGSWDGGSRRRMCKDKSGDIWFSEVVLTPENQDTFGIKLMKFAFEDENVDDRALSPYESDYALILKKDWAKTDSYATVNSDPAVTPNKKEKLYDEKTNTINLVYPVKK